MRSNLERVGKGQYMTVAGLELRGSEICFSGLHLDILVYRAANQTVERVETQGVWLGVMEDTTSLLSDNSLRLEPGDTLLLYTDGLTEAKSQDGLLGTGPVISRFQALAARTTQPAAIVKGMLGLLDDRAANDDVTLMAVRYAPIEDPEAGMQVPASRPEGVAADFRIQAELEPIWSTVRDVRKRLKQELSEYPMQIRNAAAMVASELLENAIKYGETVPKAPKISFSFTLKNGVFRIVVSNGAGSGQNVQRLQEHINALNSAEDRSALYLHRLQELLECPAQSSGLGVYRIGYEGGFDLDCVYADNVVTVSATRSTQ